jgi:hypothetical protein
MGAVPRPRILPDALMAAGLGTGALGLLDPRLAPATWLGPSLAILAYLLKRGGTRAALAALALCVSVASWARPEFRADAGSYFVYLRSLAFDRDVDFANDWTLLGHPPASGRRTVTGKVHNAQTIGPALLWAPFYAAAHLYVRASLALGLGSWPADGASEPYRRACALGTVTAVVLAAFPLARALAARFTPALAAVAVAAAFLTSPVVYYVFVAPGMAHGLAFALAAVLLALLDRLRGGAWPGGWWRVGACFGLLVLVRTQAAVLGLLVLPFAVRAWRRREVSGKTLAGAGILAGTVFVPQMLAWKALYGSYLTVPQGAGYLDWSSPHLLEVLFSANHGLFSWSPALALGLLGLVLHLRRDRGAAAGSLLVLAALAWTNGAVADWDWEGGDAFGARRFDVAVPFFALGFAALAAWLRELASRRPMLLPAVVLLPFALWNLGLLAAFRTGRYPDAAPLDRVARDQARLLRRVATGALGALFGQRGRAAAYELFAGEYLFGAPGRDGVLRLASADERTLVGGFSPPAWREGGPAFRWALFPEACLDLPLRGEARPGALDLLARAPRKALPQTLSLVLNGVEQGRAELGPEWTSLRFAVAPGSFRPGENRLCLRFARALPGEEDRPAAAVAELALAQR